MQKKQFGRSMIEMLGVLAIIGVLSIGGLLGYRRAVNNHQANTILDDVNRFAFVILERSGLALGEVIPKGDFVESGIYTLEGYQDIEPNQFSITVKNVPKGVCEPLLTKAVIEYKVRVNPSEGVKGKLYDTLNKGLCNNDTNVMVFYFGDTTDLCNPKENGYTPCTVNSDCCGGEFCFYVNAIDTDKLGNGNGRCEAISLFLPVSTADGAWIRTGNANDVGMNWYSAQNFCEALGKKPVTRVDIGCEDETSNCDTDIMKSLKQRWNVYGCNWLEGYGETAEWRKMYARLVRFSTKELSACKRNGCNCAALCH